jgi:hypothetical protein
MTSSSTVATSSTSAAATSSTSAAATSSTSAAATSSTSAAATSSTSTVASTSTSASENIFTELFYNNNVDDFIHDVTAQLQLENKVFGIEIITINNTINVVKEIWDWIKNTDSITLLKKPVISVITER